MLLDTVPKSSFVFTDQPLLIHSPPWPNRILDDIGGAFGMGAVGGGLWHLLKGMKNSPSGARFRGGALAISAQD